MPLREPADKFELEQSGLPRDTQLFPLPTYAKLAVPFKFVLPMNEAEFQKRGCPQAPQPTPFW